MNRDDANEMEFAPIAQQAAHWWTVLQGENVSAADYREFSEWVMRSPERVEAVLRAAQLMRALKSEDVRWPDISAEALIREAKAAPAEVVHFQARAAEREAPAARHEPSLIRSFLPRFAAIAATVVVAVAASWFWFTSPQTYRTAFGEQRSVVLEDGSLVTLNTSSEIEVTIDDSRRTIRLVSGEALFHVAHETRRPFDVLAGHATVRAVGTQFNVDRHAAANTTVTVVEGKVAVLRQRDMKSKVAPEAAPTFLTASERTVITASQVGAPERVANLGAATAWTQRQLVFERRPLGEVAAEFNRYNRRLIAIDSAELRDQEVTGVFQANDPESFVAFLSRIPGVNVQQSDSGISVTAKN